MENPECVLFRKLRTPCGSDLNINVDLVSQVCNHLRFNAGDSIFKIFVSFTIYEKVQGEIVRACNVGTDRYQ